MKARRRSWGAEVIPGEGVHFRVFAPRRDGVEVVLGADPTTRSFSLEREPHPGAWSGFVAGLAPGTLYRYRLAGEELLLPDPVSRFQPSGPLGASEIIDPTFAWTDPQFRGLPRRGQVIYELHIGTFTPEGTWSGARRRLPELAALGITVIELMPVATFPGSRGWSYDGVSWSAPYAGYGRPEDMRRFVDDAHRLGLGVILDVVYNHLGAVGNFLSKFFPEYLAPEPTEWGDALNFDGPGSAAMRDLVQENVLTWLDEFHLDGFRLDATQTIKDSSQTHILAELVRAARASSAKTLFFVAENEPQDSRLVRDAESGGMGLDAIWNDDLHHTAVVTLTGQRDAYFTDYTGRARELLACVKHGFLFQGQRYDWQKKNRGTSTRGLAPSTFVAFLENHDQLANFGLGQRLWMRSAPGQFRALTALLLLAPWTPMLFQGQEWNATSPFNYFADVGDDLAATVVDGRATFLEQFKRYASEAARARFPTPGALKTFEDCVLKWDEREHPLHARALALHHDLLALRRTDATLSGQDQGQDAGFGVDGATLTERAFVLRYFSRAANGVADRLLTVNLGPDWEPESLAEPLMAPPAGHAWRTVWSSDHPRYGGEGIRGPRPERDVFLAGNAASFMIPSPTGAA